MLFKLDKQNRIFIHPEAILLCPELKSLNCDEILFVCVFCDYNSPYHQLPEEERLRRAKHHVWADTNKNTDSPILQAGIEAYRGLQYDYNRELVIKYKSKINMLSNALLNTNKAKEIKEIDEAIERLNDRIEKTQKQIDQSDELSELRGGGELTWIEKWQRGLRERKAAKEREGIVEIG